MTSRYARFWTTGSSYVPASGPSSMPIARVTPPANSESLWHWSSQPICCRVRKLAATRKAAQRVRPIQLRAPSRRLSLPPWMAKPPHGAHQALTTKNQVDEVITRYGRPLAPGQPSTLQTRPSPADNACGGSTLGRGPFYVNNPPAYAPPVADSIESVQCWATWAPTWDCCRRPDHSSGWPDLSRRRP